MAKRKKSDNLNFAKVEVNGYLSDGTRILLFNSQNDKATEPIKWIVNRNEDINAGEAIRRSFSLEANWVEKVGKAGEEPSVAA